MSDERKRKFIGLYTGNKFWPMDPRTEDVNVEDIVNSLTKKCRFSGHTKIFWSVAQHSIMVDNILCFSLQQAQNPRVRLAGVLHDGLEAYLPDVARPVKEYLSGFGEIEDNVQQIVWEAFGIGDLTEEEKKLVKRADDIGLMVEAKTIMPRIDGWNILNDWDTDYDDYCRMVKEERFEDVRARFASKIEDLASQVNNK